MSGLRGSQLQSLSKYVQRWPSNTERSNFSNSCPFPWKLGLYCWDETCWDEMWGLSIIGMPWTNAYLNSLVLNLGKYVTTSSDILTYWLNVGSCFVRVIKSYVFVQIAGCDFCGNALPFHRFPSVDLLSCESCRSPVLQIASRSLPLQDLQSTKPSRFLWFQSLPEGRHVEIKVGETFCRYKLPPVWHSTVSFSIYSKAQTFRVETNACFGDISASFVIATPWWSKWHLPHFQLENSKALRLPPVQIMSSYPLEHQFHSLPSQP